MCFLTPCCTVNALKGMLALFLSRRAFQPPKEKIYIRVLNGCHRTSWHFHTRNSVCTNLISNLSPQLFHRSHTSAVGFSNLSKVITALGLPLSSFLSLLLHPHALSAETPLSCIVLSRPSAV